MGGVTCQAAKHPSMSSSTCTPRSPWGRYPSRLLVTLIITKCLCGRVGFAQIHFRCCIQEFRDGAANLRESKDRQNVTPLYPALSTKFYTVVPGISDGLPCLNFVNCSICMMSSKLSKRCKTGILLYCQKMNTHTYTLDLHVILDSHHMWALSNNCVSLFTCPHAMDLLGATHQRRSIISCLLQAHAVKQLRNGGVPIKKEGVGKYECIC
jgi:hypothetical protein